MLSRFENTIRPIRNSAEKYAACFPVLFSCHCGYSRCIAAAQTALYNCAAVACASVTCAVILKMSSISRPKSFSMPNLPFRSVFC